MSLGFGWWPGHLLPITCPELPGRDKMVSEQRLSGVMTAAAPSTPRKSLFLIIYYLMHSHVIMDITILADRMLHQIVHDSLGSQLAHSFGFGTNPF